MATPSTRTPVRIARGSYSNLNSSLSDLQDGEIMYAEDQDICLRSWHSNLKVIYHSDVECYHSYGRKGSSLMPSKYNFYQLISTINMFKKFNFQ